METKAIWKKEPANGHNYGCDHIRRAVVVDGKVQFLDFEIKSDLSNIDKDIIMHEIISNFIKHIKNMNPCAKIEVVPTLRSESGEGYKNILSPKEFDG